MPHQSFACLFVCPRARHFRGSQFVGFAHAMHTHLTRRGCNGSLLLRPAFVSDGSVGLIHGIVRWAFHDASHHSGCHEFICLRACLKRGHQWFRLLIPFFGRAAILHAGALQLFSFAPPLCLFPRRFTAVGVSMPRLHVLGSRMLFSCPLFVLVRFLFFFCQRAAPFPPQPQDLGRSSARLCVSP